ncbi:unnamed protein product [Phytophthora lilii]|uniref:Unnamed protein product n=1 Tax=Phytophthora lilii TaxID=2077276 RepID=A0A9W6XE99_9STRA|nr:unnamed protein product [Phytophthora lilii]
MNCSDKQWCLVERMCVFDPKKRLKVSTVVDELARLASGEDEVDDGELSTDTLDNLESVSEVISGVKAWLIQRQEEGSQTVDTP